MRVVKSFRESIKRYDAMRQRPVTDLHHTVYHMLGPKQRLQPSDFMTGYAAYHDRHMYPPAVIAAVRLALRDERISQAHLDLLDYDDLKASGL